MYRPTEDKNFISRTEMYENIVSLLGGRVAEELVIGDISTGASTILKEQQRLQNQWLLSMV
jgi:cell division protease FtsH